MDRFRQTAKREGLTQAALLSALLNLWNGSPETRSTMMKVALFNWAVQAMGGPEEVLRQYTIMSLKRTAQSYESVLSSNFNSDESKQRVKLDLERIESELVDLEGRTGFEIV
jgi:hypothetical protein